MPDRGDQVCVLAGVGRDSRTTCSRAAGPTCGNNDFDATLRNDNGRFVDVSVSSPAKCLAALPSVEPSPAADASNNDGPGTVQHTEHQPQAALHLAVTLIWARR
ncbi:hypothetical protein [Streptomyces sp. NPDC048720]|uniref:hypothetical protein n=1 Tax=Streptomyces sp. NPDC048720 TaxID=3365588 RepID=UPI00371F8FFA